jgi:hypothetical protein
LHDTARRRRQLVVVFLDGHAGGGAAAGAPAGTRGVEVAQALAMQPFMCVYVIGVALRWSLDVAS